MIVVGRGRVSSAAWGIGGIWRFFLVETDREKVWLAVATSRIVMAGSLLIRSRSQRFLFLAKGKANHFPRCFGTHMRGTLITRNSSGEKGNTVDCLDNGHILIPFMLSRCIIRQPWPDLPALRCWPGPNSATSGAERA
jgi:hypothetical protein